MNFGVRLPGPFRVGVNSRGRMNVGVTAGPFSVSTGVGGQRAGDREPFHSIDLDGALGVAVAQGWRVRSNDGRIAYLTQGWQARQIEAVEGGVTWRQVTSRRKAIAVTILFLALAVACWGLTA